MRIEDIRQAIELGNIRISDHADDEMAADGFLLDEVLEATKLGEIIENYPSDYPLPSCLVLGYYPAGDPLHAVWAYNERSGRAVLVTVYRPDPENWIDWRGRKDKR